MKFQNKHVFIIHNVYFYIGTLKKTIHSGQNKFEKAF